MKSELARRIVFTLGALLIYRLGTHIPLPGISSSGDRFVGVAGARFSIFALWILPYLSAAIMIQLVSMVSSRLGALSGSGEAGRRKIARYTLGLAMLLTAFQAFGVAGSLQGIPNFVSEPGAFFLLSTTLTLTGGTMFLVWLSEQITERGIGNGLALMLFAGVVTKTPQEVASVLELTRQGALSVERAWLLAVFWVALVGLVVFVELSRRRVPVEFAARTLGERLIPAQSSYLSIKLNSSGVIPSVVGPWFYLLPLSIAGFAFGWTSPWLVATYTQMAPGHIGHMILASVAIRLCRRSRACRGFPEEVWRCDPENRTGRADRRACRSRRVLYDLCWRSLSGRGFPDTRGATQLFAVAVLFGWQFGANCGLHYS
jgi:preprotein translocase subunit SecY